MLHTHHAALLDGTVPTPAPDDWSETALFARLAELKDALPGNPETIGDYHIVRRLDEGGMGIVYEAVQKRLGLRVALKIIRHGFMSVAMLRRFEYEASVLARLEHPGIARIHYAGIWDSGSGPQPFFAMEFVEGRKLNEFVASQGQRLKLRDRVALFLEICRTVQHAHSKGIVHRDLKPSNILVTAEGKPKILDFGVARAVNGELQVASLHTESGQLIGTLPYMAPEQAAGKVHELDSSSDVYALGVIAYELFSGRMPYSLEGKPLHEAVQMICESEPSRLRSFDRSLDPDVETIVLKAMEKDKARRYASAGELAADLKRYLDCEPITARRPSTSYQLSRFAKRNKLLVGSVAALILVLLGAAIISTFFAVHALQQRRLAEGANKSSQAVIGFFINKIVGAANPAVHPGRELTVKEAVDLAAEHVRIELAERPEVEAAIRDMIATTYQALGRAEEGLQHAQIAVELRRQALGEDHPLTLSSTANLALLLVSKGELAQGESILRATLDRARRALGDNHPVTVNCITQFAFALGLQARFAEAEPFYREALDRHRRISGEHHPDTLTALNNFAYMLQEQGKLEEAEKQFRIALLACRKSLEPDHPDTLRAMNNMGHILQARGKLDEAQPLLQEALERRREVLGDDHPDTLTSMNNLAHLWRIRGAIDEAAELFRETLERRRRVLGNLHHETLISINSMGYILQAQGKLDEAEAHCLEALEGRRHTLGETNPSTLRSYHNLSQLLAARGRWNEAEQYCQKALDGRRHTLGEDHPETLNSLHGLAVITRDCGRPEEAVPLFEDVLNRRRRVLGNNHALTVGSLFELGSLLRAQQRADQALPLLKEALDRAPTAQLPPGQVSQIKTAFESCLSDVGSMDQPDQPVALGS